MVVLGSDCCGTRYSLAFVGVAPRVVSFFAQSRSTNSSSSNTSRNQFAHRDGNSGSYSSINTGFAHGKT